MSKAWADIQEGSVIKAPSGLFRIVRKLSPGISDRKKWVLLVIQHCSWTGRCYTTYNVGELKQLGYTVTGAVVKLRRKKDKQIAAEFGKHRTERKLTCCDVHGLG